MKIFYFKNFKLKVSSSKRTCIGRPYISLFKISMIVCFSKTNILPVCIFPAESHNGINNMRVNYTIINILIIVEFKKGLSLYIIPIALEILQVIY